MFRRSLSQIADYHRSSNVIVESRSNARQLLGLVPRKLVRGKTKIENDHLGPQATDAILRSLVVT